MCASLRHSEVYLSGPMLTFAPLRPGDMGYLKQVSVVKGVSGNRC